MLLNDLLNINIKISLNWEVVVAQLVERSLPIPEVRGSNPVIGKKLLTIIVYCQLCIEKTKNKEKEAGNGPFFLKKISLNFLGRTNAL